MGSENDFHVLGQRIYRPPSPTVARATPAMATVERDNQSINQIYFLRCYLIKQQEKYNTKLETKTKQCARRLRVDLAVFKSAATVK